MTRRFREAATLPVTFALGGIVLLVGAVRTSAVGSLVVVVALIAFSWLVGESIVLRLRSTELFWVVRIPIAIALGNGLLGLFLLVLASVGSLTAVTVLGGAMAILVSLLVLDRRLLLKDFAALREWRPSAPTWFETIIIGVAVGVITYAVLAAFVPDLHYDATRDHLPIAREIWQSGSAPEFAPMGTSKHPIHAHLLYAIAYGFGGLPAAELVHTATGLIAIIGIAGIGWLCSGRLAAIVGATIFATMPLVLAELGIALVDLFPTFFSVAAVLCVLLWQREDRRDWLLGAGALAAFGFAAKMTMGLMIVALAAAIFLVGREPQHWRDRFLALVAFGVGGAVVVPWLVRSYAIRGDLEGMTILFEHATGSATSDLISFGMGRSPLDLVRIPWNLTFYGEQFHQEGTGDIGILLLLLLPLVLFAPRTRAVAFLAVTAGISFVGWAITAQLTRYLLPTLGLAAALAGIGAASAVAASIGPWQSSRLPRLLTVAVPASVIIGLVVVPLLLSSERTLGLLVDADVITGSETAAEFVAEEKPAAMALTAASALLPPDTKVGYISSRWWDAAGIYTEARLFDLVGPRPGQGSLGLAWLGKTPEKVLASLDKLDINYFIWSRYNSSPELVRSALFSPDFLRNHTRILEGDRGVYLFEILPGGGEGWGRLDENLLEDPGLETVKEGGPWITWGRIEKRKGVISLVRRNSTLTQQVPVSAGAPYLLTASAACKNPTDQVRLVLTWSDADGIELGTEEETVIPGVRTTSQFLWHRAPQRATTVSVGLTGAKDCQFDEAALYGPS
jgi:hypothetical protein